jgi:ATP-binding cassette subfamily F protein 3
MITIQNIDKSFGEQILFTDTSLQINERDRFALVGPNGSGKSTLMKMIIGQVEQDKGKIDVRKGTFIGYLPQEYAPISDRTVLAEALSRFDNPDGSLIAKVKAILMGLGFKVPDFEKSVGTLSGGWVMRIAIAQLLIQEPELLLLDEPTNHLDLDSLLWFQQYLQKYNGAIFLISHDRSFINVICSAIVSIQEHLLKTYYGDYDSFVKAREIERKNLEAAHRQQLVQITRMQKFIDRNRARASTASRAQSMIKSLEKIERIVIPSESKTVRIQFPQPKRTGLRVLSLDKLFKSYDSVKVYEGLDFQIERGMKMVFVGHNGAGKSTLLKLLAGIIPYDSGKRIIGLNVKVGYYSQHRTDMLNPNKTVLEEASDNTQIGQTELMVRNVLGTFLFPGDTVYKKVSVLSGGEKSRLALVKLLLDPPNLLLMDEPTMHLDMDSVEALIAALDKFEGTLCLISHDLYFINSLANRIVHIDRGRITIYTGNYEYFQRRLSQNISESREEKPSKSLKPVSINKARLRRQERAKERAIESKRTRQEQRIKAEMTATSERMESLTKQLEDPSIYNDYSRVKAIGDEIQDLQNKLESNELELSKINNV